MERGYVGSGLQQIVAQSGATIGSLYHFFPGGKADLAAETLRVSGAAYQALVEAVFDAAPNVVSGVQACYEGAAATLEMTDYADACPIATVALEVASSDEPLRQVTAEIFDSWLFSATSRLEAGGVAPERARQLAVLLVAALEGGFLLSRAAKDPAPMQTIGRLVAELVEAAVAAS
jgi:AcrR family transcriptional regulator